MMVRGNGYYDPDAPPDPFIDAPDLMAWFFGWRGVVLLVVFVVVFATCLTWFFNGRHEAHLRENKRAEQSCVERGGRPVEDQYGWFTECHWD